MGQDGVGPSRQCLITHGLKSRSLRIRASWFEYLTMTLSMVEGSGLRFDRLTALRKIEGKTDGGSCPSEGADGSLIIYSELLKQNRWREKYKSF